MAVAARFFFSWLRQGGGGAFVPPVTPDAPANALSWRGEPLTWRGEILTWR